MDPLRPASDPVSRRRSTRVAESIFFTVSGTDATGQPFVEQTGTVNLSFHGCSYFSKQAAPKNSWLSLEIPNQAAGGPPHKIRARVAWNRKSRNLPGLALVGVEFEAPCNVWGLAAPPPDWQSPDAKEPKPTKASDIAFEAEIEKLLALSDTGTYYQLLKVTSESPCSDIKRNYYEFVRKCHPDRHMNHPEWTQSLEQIMQAATLAYKTLSDDATREAYDRTLAASGTFALNRHATDARQTTDQYVQAGRQCFRAKDYGGSILWLRKAVHNEPQSGLYHTLLARSLAMVPAYRREAMEHLEKAVSLDPTNIAAHLQIAELYENLQLPWRARTHYEQVLQIDSDNRSAQDGLRLLDAAENKESARKRSLADHILHPFK
jgi:curved DNA-binding protein CbpA